MRKPEYMSPTSLKTFEGNRDEFYLKYLAENRPPRLPQTIPMSVGSAFDAYCKSYLHHALHGNYGDGDAYRSENIFEKQVEPHNRDQAKVDGKYVFDCYKKCGALSDLMIELNKSVGKPRFEFDIKGTLESRVGSVPLLGKPDIFFINSQGARVILDWKVNGFYSNSVTSPMKGYVKTRDCWEPTEKKRTPNNMMPHKDCYPTDVNGIKINSTMFLEEGNVEWADQLNIYAWLLGEPVGSESLIIGIDQICGSPGRLLRVVSHRLRSRSAYQFTLLDRLVTAWQAIEAGHIFQELSFEESQERQAHLEDVAKGLSAGDDFSKFVNEVSRKS